MGTLLPERPAAVWTLKNPTITILAATTLCVTWLAFAQTATPTPTSKPLDAAEDLELKTISGQLSDPARDAKTKAEAADLLVTRPYAQAIEITRTLLSDTTNPSAQIAIAAAISRQGGRDEYIDALVAMLVGSEPSVRAPAGKALVTYKQPRVTAQLIKLATDVKGDKAVRVAVIATLQSMLDKQAVDALVRLLDDTDATIRDAAMDALTKLTNIRTFGKDRWQWVMWWNLNKNKDRNEWLADLAESLGKTKTALDTKNLQLTTRLTKALLDLYALTPAAQRDAMLLALLKEPLPEVRLAGTAMIQKKIETGLLDEISPEVRSQARLMLADTDPQIREAAAMVLANLGDTDTLAVLVEQLKVEETPSVQAALLMAMGQLHDSKAVPALLSRLGSKYDIVSTAAATSLGRIAAKQPLQGTQLADAVKTLIDRYKQIDTAGQMDGVALRESLLGTMGTIGKKEFLPVLQAALQDNIATVRWAAVTGLGKLGDSSAAAPLQGLMSDPDRGVRQAAIATVGTLGGEKYIQAILQHTDATEAEATVRQQAWDTALAILANASEDTLGDTCAALSKRTDAGAYQIRVMQLLVAKLKIAKSKSLRTRQRELAAALLKSDRPDEAAEQLADVFGATPSGDAQAKAIWLEWVDAMLAAADPAVGKVMADQTDDELFQQAVNSLTTRLSQLVAAQKQDAAIVLLEEVDRRLGQRLTSAQRGGYKTVLTNCRAGQAAADVQRVAKLALQLLAAEETARKAAQAELTIMGDRAVKPLVGELRKNLASAKPNPQVEIAILTALKQLSPQLAGYDSAAAVADRLKTLDKWSGSPTTKPE